MVSGFFLFFFGVAANYLYKTAATALSVCGSPLEETGYKLHQNVRNQNWKAALAIIYLHTTVFWDNLWYVHSVLLWVDLLSDLSHQTTSRHCLLQRIFVLHHKKIFFCNRLLLQKIVCSAPKCGSFFFLQKNVHKSAFNGPKRTCLFMVIFVCVCLPYGLGDIWH